MRVQLLPILTSILSILSPLALAIPADRTPKKHGGYDKNSECWTGKGKGFFPLEDAQTVADALRSTSPDKDYHVRRKDSQHWELGLFRVCVNNDFLGWDTHVTEHQIGEELQGMLNRCCDVTQHYCEGGYTQIEGSTKLYLDVTTHPARTVCK
ncbi:MAG: hypothetical protein Q9204_009173 [Flavoplaca sp. TL-2023a]